MMLLVFVLSCASTLGAWVARDVRIDNGRFRSRATGEWEYLHGTNVVQKGPPWIPAVDGSTRCGADPNVTTCATFNTADAEYIKSKGWNVIRLGVVWAGAQPTPEPILDPAWVSRLHAILELCHSHSVRVILDIHQDAMGTAMCGEGVPMWFSKLHFPHLVGKPVVGIESKLGGKCSVFDFAAWAEHAGDPLYNVLNECCVAINAPGPWGKYTIPTDFTQLTVTQLIGTDAGRLAYSTYVGLLTRAVAQHPAAVAIELMNEPPMLQLEAPLMYRLFKQCYDAIRAVAPDIAVGIADSGNIAQADDSHLPNDAKAWLRNASHLFYAFHWYSGFPASPSVSVERAINASALWGAVPFMTEFSAGDNLTRDAANSRGVGWTEYMYSSYCNVPLNPQCAPDMPCAFGACIT